MNAHAYQIIVLGNFNRADVRSYLTFGSRTHPALLKRRIILVIMTAHHAGFSRSRLLSQRIALLGQDNQAIAQFSRLVGLFRRIITEQRWEVSVMKNS